MNVVYLDESGDHSLDKIDPTYPMFVLGGVIVDRSYARTVIVPRLRALKETFFLRSDLILHTADLIRARNGFESLKDRETRASFFDALNATMRELEYTVVACAIKKDAHLARFGVQAEDPYKYSLRILVDRFCREVGDIPDGGYMCVEKRGPELDRELERAWSRLRREGTSDLSAGEIDERIVDLGIKEKGLDIAGLELADLVVSPVGRYVAGKPTREDWEIVKGKLRRRGGTYHGHGLVVLPE